MIDWQQFDKGIFLVNVLGIVYDKKSKKILIGKRENDPFTKELAWCFPGGRPAYGKSLEEALNDEVRKKASVEIRVKKIVYARPFPEKKEFLLVYYYCEFKKGTAKAGDKITELKWVRPSEVKKYFTTSIADEVLDFLQKLK